jgi:hypothetical protein
VRGKDFATCAGQEGQIELDGDVIVMDEESGKNGSLDAPWVGGKGYS